MSVLSKDGRRHFYRQTSLLCEIFITFIITTKVY